MKVLLHICCAPCSIFPIKMLKQEKMEIMGFFFRHNIHPYTECIKREETLKEYADEINLKVIYQKEYELEKFIQQLVFRESDRCRFCYHERLLAACKIAKKGKFDAFTSTLLYSKFQNHDLIRETGNAIGKKEGIKFLYRDFRVDWKNGIQESKQLEMYRQQYCGCIYSEKERYFKNT
ncbi:MAG: epoxyqueuosine reductase QueH [Desulfobacteraceae bacterium]|nr:epoxyqueuosine reductase QueH [Desulfobacteraceae bacterium]